MRGNFDKLVSMVHGVQLTVHGLPKGTMVHGAQLTVHRVLKVSMVHGEQLTVHGFQKNEYMPFQFEKLKVWNEALRLSGEVAELAKIFPKDELFVLTSQLKRVADSVVLNIAEGSTLQSRTEFKRFLVIANRSALEVVACFYLARERKLIQQEIFEKFYTQYENLIKGIQALIKTLN